MFSAVTEFYRRILGYFFIMEFISLRSRNSVSERELVIKIDYTFSTTKKILIIIRYLSHLIDRNWHPSSLISLTYYNFRSYITKFLNSG